MKFAMCVKNIDVKLPIVPKLKLLGNSEFNHLTIILRLPLTCRPKFPPNKWMPNKWEFNMLNYQLSQSLSY